MALMHIMPAGLLGGHLSFHGLVRTAGAPQLAALPVAAAGLPPLPGRMQAPFRPRGADWSTQFLGRQLALCQPALLPAYYTLCAPVHLRLDRSLPGLPSRPFSARAAARKGDGGGGGAGGGTGGGGSGAAHALVVVESPSKATTVGRYLGPDYAVLASYGHVRDLAPTPGSVQPDNEWAMTWAVPVKAHKCLAAIRAALRGKRLLVLASDPDREGEAIAWHLQETLREAGALNNTQVIRVAFNEITRDAVLAALAAPRDVSTPLVEAYLARRALDYVMGFGLSPVLWRKLPGSKSAGRVQSVALRLVTDREHAIRTFVSREHWSVAARLTGPTGDVFEAALTHLDARKLGQFGLTTEEDAQQAAGRVRAARLEVAEVKRSKVERSPPPPFTTSTLQQEASAKLSLGAAQTMALAQKLYEGADTGAGLITYMRTDATTLSSHAVTAIRATVAARYGPEYVPARPRVYKSQAKNAQEAHEAIRPTDMAVLPSALAGRVDPSALRLYSLIWRRTAACQMASAVYAQLAVDVASADQAVRLHAVASEVQFPGHLAVHSDAEVGSRFAREQVPETDEAESGEDAVPGKRAGLERLAVGQAVAVGAVTPDQHFTQPPPRFTEGTLVKALEEAGVGRPSTYASTLRTLVERAYVRKEGRRLVPEMRGLLVAAFLQHYFPRYVDTAFTAQLEAQLDDITAGACPYKAVLSAFHTDLQAAINDTAAISKQQVEDALEAAFGDWLFPAPAAKGADPRACPVCGQGQLELKLSKMGGFLGCSHYPECTARLPLTFGSPLDMSTAGGCPVVLGDDPVTGLPVSLRTGPYGPYLQLGEAQGKAKPKRVALPKGLGADVDLPRALQLLALPLPLGEHPALGGPVSLSLGRFGPYVEHAGNAASLPPGPRDMFAFTLAEAVPLLAAKGKPLRGRGRPSRGNTNQAAAADKAPAKRGRKKKEAAVKEGADVKTLNASAEDGKAEEVVAANPPKKRGRPRKVVAQVAEGEETPKDAQPALEARPGAAATDEDASSIRRDGEEHAGAPPPKRKGKGAEKKSLKKVEAGLAAAQETVRRAKVPGKALVAAQTSEQPASSAGKESGGASRDETPGSGPQLRILTEWPSKRRSPAEKAADHAAGVFRPWEVQNGLHLPWLQQQEAARAAAQRNPGADHREGGAEASSAAPTTDERQETPATSGRAGSPAADKMEGVAPGRGHRMRPALKAGRPSKVVGRGGAGLRQGEEEEQARYAVAAGH